MLESTFYEVMNLIISASREGSEVGLAAQLRLKDRAGGIAARVLMKLRRVVMF